MVPEDEETNDTEGFQSYQEHKIVAREIQKNELQIAKHELIDKKVCKNVISWEITFLGFSCLCNFYILKLCNHTIYHLLSCFIGLLIFFGLFILYYY